MGSRRRRGRGRRLAEGGARAWQVGGGAVSDALFLLARSSAEAGPDLGSEPASEPARAVAGDVSWRGEGEGPAALAAAAVAPSRKQVGVRGGASGRLPILS